MWILYGDVLSEGLADDGGEIELEGLRLCFNAEMLAVHRTCMSYGVRPFRFPTEVFIPYICATCDLREASAGPTPLHSRGRRNKQLLARPLGEIRGFMACTPDAVFQITFAGRVE